MRIVLLAALPQETQHLLRRFKPWEKVPGTPFTTVRHMALDREILLIETGMGKKAVSKALAHLSTNPLQCDLLFSIGFAGGLNGSLSAGDVCMVEEFIDHVAPSEPRLRLESTRSLEHLCRIKLPSVTCLTVKAPSDKLLLASTTERSCALVDMESYHAAFFAHDRSLAFLCIRAVSDGLHDVLGFEISAVSDSTGRISMIGVARTILRNPSTAISFLKCRQRANLAADRLADTVTRILTLPIGELKNLAGEIRVISTNASSYLLAEATSCKNSSRELLNAGKSTK